MSIFISPIPTDPNVKYDGKTLPKDKAPYNPPVTDANVSYNGAVLPRDAVKYVPPAIDQSNIPSLVVLGTLATVVSPFAGVVVSPPPITGATLPNGGIILPADVQIRWDVEKIIADTTIIDGVQVTEHIRRGPYVVEMEFTIRAKTNAQWIFGQDFLDQITQKIILPDTVIYVQNTMLNKKGISQLILRKENGETVRGSINIPMTLRFTENIVGESLIVS